MCEATSSLFFIAKSNVRTINITTFSPYRTTLGATASSTSSEPLASRFLNIFFRNRHRWCVMCGGHGGSDLKLVCTHIDFLAQAVPRAVLWERYGRGGTTFANVQYGISSRATTGQCARQVFSQAWRKVFLKTQEITCEANNRGRKR